VVGNRDAEWMLQFAIVCVCLGDPKRLDGLDAAAFDAEFGQVVSEMQRREFRSLDELMSRVLKVTRSNGTKWSERMVDAMQNVAAWNRLKRENEPLWRALRMALWDGRRADVLPSDVMEQLKSARQETGE
jgi:hypothetical protein